VKTLQPWGITGESPVILPLSASPWRVLVVRLICRLMRVDAWICHPPQRPNRAAEAMGYKTMKLTVTYE